MQEAEVLDDFEMGLRAGQLINWQAVRAGHYEGRRFKPGDRVSYGVTKLLPPADPDNPHEIVRTIEVYKRAVVIDVVNGVVAVLNEAGETIAILNSIMQPAELERGWVLTG